MLIKKEQPWLNNLASIVDGLSLENVFNLDETALYFRRLPTRSIASGKSACIERKVSKDRLTLCLIVNTSGTYRKAAVIGESKKPRCFGKTWDPATHLGIPYYSNSSAWMKSDIFSDILTCFNREVSARPDKVWLLMDNADCHKPPVGSTMCSWEKKFRGFTMSRVNVVFFPPNTTSLVQPLDMRILKLAIANFMLKESSPKWMILMLQLRT